MTLVQMAKRAVNRILAATNTGHRIDHDAVIPRFGRLADHLDQAGLTPVTIFEIGVAYGTPWLYERWPRAKFFLIDPLPQSLPHMQKWAERLNAEVLNIALGDKDGTVPINVRHDHDLGGSTILNFSPKNAVAARIEVPIRRFDQAVRAFRRPALMKIDVQGAERIVIEGVGDRITELDCIIMETSLIADTEQGQPDFAAMVALMRERGFVMYDIVTILRRPLDQALAQMDAVFVPDSSVLRQVRRWEANPCIPITVQFAPFQRTLT